MQRHHKLSPETDGNIYDRAILAAGCFWGVEYYLAKLEGVVKTRVGYVGGEVANPTYEEVCSGDTGHKEAIEIIYDQKELSYADLLRAFFEIHDFSQRDGQGPDIGTQYKSAIYYLTPEQKNTAQNIVEKLKENNYTVATKIYPASVFYDAEEYHQDYYGKNGQQPYCHVRKKLTVVF